MARLPDVLRALAQKCGLAIVADSYSDDPTVPRLRVQPVPERVAVPQLASLFRRRVLEVDGVLLLRHEQWLTKANVSSRLYPWPHPPTGQRREIARLIDPGTPRVRCMVDEVGLPELSQSLRREASVSLSIPGTLAGMRVSIAAQSISVTQLAGAIGDLIVATPGVSISRSLTQSEYLRSAYAEAVDPRSPRERTSDELKDELAGVLTPEERGRLAAFQSVAVDISRLSPSARRKALNYAESCWAEIQESDPTAQGQALDLRRGVKLNLHPISSLALGVHTFKLDGTRVGF
jgi:hypothetical protein